ncbi:hypothetical protein RhiJN_21298 [Ceratobasidium sp. AG-Ba]|nr:hypothetical protein RhiJN_21298 [Ceratobasidium sp. AG-Ba]
MDDEPIASISQRFHAEEPEFRDADLVFLTTDSVFFYAHTSVLLQESCNRFGGLIPVTVAPDDDLESLEPGVRQDNGAPEVRLVISDYSSTILEIVLSAIYKTNAEWLDPSSESLQEAITALHALGCDPNNMTSPGSLLFLCSLRAAEREPLIIFAIAAEHRCEDLAVAVSRLISADLLYGITDELAERMGPIYLKRILCALQSYFNRFLN